MVCKFVFGRRAHTVNVVRKGEIYVSAFDFFFPTISRDYALARPCDGKFEPVQMQMRRGISIRRADFFPYLIKSDSVYNERRGYELIIYKVFSVFMVFHDIMITENSLKDNE